MNKVKFEINVPTQRAMPEENPEFETHSEVSFQPEQDFNRLYIKVDDRFDISIRRTEEGVIVDIYAGHDFQDLMDSAQALDSDIINPEDIECG